jgi:hypothetical protein
MQRRGYNGLKKHALAVFVSKGGWLNPPAWAVLAGFYPVRASWTYLLRLHRFGLLQRRRDPRGLVLYRLTERGRRRLVWLSRV